MRYLGVDYGSKRVGTALSDDQGLMAFPHKVIENNKELVSEITSIIKSEGISEIVVGLSLGRDGNPNEIHKAVEEFITDLTLAVGLPVHLEPEQYTTQEAVRFQGKNETTDASAAAIILNSYIVRQQNTK